MLHIVPLLTCLIFSVLYPLCFWVGYDQPLKNNFHRFHIGLPNCIGGVVTIAYLLNPTLTLPTKILLLFWFILFLSISAYYWNKEYPDARVMTIPAIVGTIAFVLIQGQMLTPVWDVAFISILDGAILCAALFAMNLGHWYLNVHGLSLEYLKRSVLAFWILTPVRLIWDIYYLLSHKVVSEGTAIPTYQFLFTLDGFLIWVGIFFGTLLPLVCLYFVYETVKVKSTQSATGILYVILSAVLLGDITYKFYLIKFGLPL